MNEADIDKDGLLDEKEFIIFLEKLRLNRLDVQ